MNLHLLFALTLALSVPAAAQPTYEPYAPADWKLPEADAQKWVLRLKKLCPPQGWTVFANGNDVVIVRDKPVVFGTEGLLFKKQGEPLTAVPNVEGTYRLTLRFGPEMSFDKYESLAAANSEAEKQDRLLQDKYDLPRILELPTPQGFENARARKAAHFEESKKLVFHGVPDFYATDASVTLYKSWRLGQILDPNNLVVADECNDVLDNIVKCFGTYNYQVALGRGAIGHHEIEAKK